MPYEFCNAERAEIVTQQALYDAFNAFVFSPDTKVFGKLIARALLAERTRHVPGDIVECGVFKGSGLLTWLKLKKTLFPAAMKKVIGFDFFDTTTLLHSLAGEDKARMTELFQERHYAHAAGGQSVIAAAIEAAGFTPAEYELVPGDIGQTAQAFVDARPGFKVSVLYLDLDLAAPTLAALTAFWPRMAKGGIVVLDEYAYHQWSESQGADAFFDDKDVTIQSLEFMSPTAYVQR